MLRPIITIDEEKCDGCGQCVTDCAEGALAIVNGKAKLISQSYCDGLGACLNCPKDALKLEMKEAPAFDGKAAMEALASRGKTSCPGSAARTLSPLSPLTVKNENLSLKAQLPVWPIQLELVPPSATFLNNADILLAAHCSGFALPELHKNLMAGRIPIIACPKLEDNAKLIDRLDAIIKDGNIASITILRMSVPCCGGLERIVQSALAKAGKKIPVSTEIVQL